MKLTTGKPAPHFSAPDQDGNAHALHDYKGKWLLLYFYPKDFTPGCTIEACSLRDDFAELSKFAAIVGVSSDAVDSHKRFAEHHQLPFTLLADLKSKMIRSYGADGIVFTKRTSFLIDPRGKIAKIYDHVNPATHAGEIVADLKLLKGGSNKNWVFKT